MNTFYVPLFLINIKLLDKEENVFLHVNSM